MKEALMSGFSFADEDIQTLQEMGVGVKKVAPKLEESILIQELQGRNFYIRAGGDKMGRKIFESTDLELIVFWGSGYENYIDTQVADEKGIPVANAPGGNSYTVAEHTSALILDSVKQISQLNDATKNGEWPIGREAWNLRGKKLGIVGMGRIGADVARIMHHGYKMDIQYFGRTPKVDLEEELGAQRVDLETLLSSSDVVSLHASATKDTLDMIGEKELAMMQPHSVLVCTSRAELVNAKALKRVLETDKIACAAFDCYYQEPILSNNKDHWGLLSLPHSKFLVTPHIAYKSDEAVRNVNAMVIENIASFLKTGRPKYLVNLEKAK